MKTRAGKFLLILAGIILAFLLAEFLVRVFLPQDKMVTWIEMHPPDFMMNWLQPFLEQYAGEQ